MHVLEDYLHVGESYTPSLTLTLVRVVVLRPRCYQLLLLDALNCTWALAIDN